MKNIEIKKMTKEQRLSHVLMLVGSYKRLMIYDIATGNKIGEEMWKKEFVTALKICQNMYLMRGLCHNLYYILI